MLDIAHPTGVTAGFRYEKVEMGAKKRGDGEAHGKRIDLLLITHYHYLFMMSSIYLISPKFSHNGWE
ncbi:hypothetical protein Cha6605_0074 [Chamaesiphon minutus PCC 6605]|uniref:Uncharacterized protein n=1 Tax=Chamaesiphon minutus (strain ATCC 27169 / PCC 6605) TaxID=1173020 RepID=K9UAD9_CHAP6|nr:hypothetical protein Cha6605_0074 [Chamaesiphon minutus PCC 6605]